MAASHRSSKLRDYISTANRKWRWKLEVGQGYKLCKPSPKTLLPKLYLLKFPKYRSLWGPFLMQVTTTKKEN